MTLPTEPIGSIARAPELLAALAERADSDDPELEPLYGASRFEAPDSPVITDGEQRKFHNFWT